MKALFRAYLPLAVSFELMMLEAPTVQTAIGHLVDPTRNYAAWGLTMQLSLLIESPVIMLLATAIALGRDRQAFAALRDFMLALAVFCTLLTALVAFTPLLDTIAGGWMGQPEAVVDAARTPLRWMLLWSAAIAWRRFYQGILVRNGGTGAVTVGTAVRLVCVAATVFLCLWKKNVTGAEAAALAIMAGVVSEAIATTLLARPVIRRNLREITPGASPLTTREIIRFHTPLAATTLLTLLAQPLTSAALARMPDSERTLAAWPVVFGALLVLRGWGYAVQEITIARRRNGGESEATLARFAQYVGVATTVSTVCLAATPLFSLYAGALGVPVELRLLARTGLLWSVGLPFLTAIGAWARGIAMHRADTVSIYVSMAIGLALQCAALVGGVFAQSGGMPTAAIAFTLSDVAVVAYLAFRRRKSPVT